MMITDLYEGLLKPASRVKKKEMSVFAVAVFENVRFVVNKEIFGAKVEYFLNMTVHRNARDRAGKYLGEPLSISSALIDQSLQESKDAGYGEDATKVRIIASILARGRIGKRLDACCVGGCPPEFKKLFENQKLAWKEKTELAKELGDTNAVTSNQTAPLKRKRGGI